MKTSELVGKTLDYAVGKIDQRDWTEEDLIANLQEDDDGYFYGPSTNWQQGGPIIEREAICVDRMISGNWTAAKRYGMGQTNPWTAAKRYGMGQTTPWTWGTTPLIAAMRCFVASHLGEEVNIPEDLE